MDSSTFHLYIITTILQNYLITHQKQLKYYYKNDIHILSHQSQFKIARILEAVTRTLKAVTHTHYKQLQYPHQVIYMYISKSINNRNTHIRST